MREQRRTSRADTRLYFLEWSGTPVLVPLYDHRNASQEQTGPAAPEVSCEPNGAKLRQADVTPLGHVRITKIHEAEEGGIAIELGDVLMAVADEEVSMDDGVLGVCVFRGVNVREAREYICGRFDKHQNSSCLEL